MEQSFRATQSASGPWDRLAQECAVGAIYDSDERQPHSTCLPGTRVDLLQSLKELVADGRHKIVWIAGESGSGKSTVAHTLADGLRAEGKLAGTYFFSRKHTKRSTFDHVLFTLAYQLGLHHPLSKEIIVKAISDDPALLSPERSRHDLLEKLVIAPLRDLAFVWKDNPGFSIVLDALDEGTTKGTPHIAPFISLLVRLVKDPFLPIQNIIISSRPWPQISSVMHDSNVSPVLRTIKLEDFDSHEDVTHLFRHAFHNICNIRLLSIACPKPWPSVSDLMLLSERAHGRFIFAATIIRSIDQEDPRSRLQLVCNMLRGKAGSEWGDIDQLYASIIDEVEPKIRPKGLEYLSLIINLAEPLALSDLDQLFSDHVHSYLVPFSALISVPALSSREPVQTYHTSFRDFLQQRERHESTAVHHHLALSCFQTMRMLECDTYKLGGTPLLHAEVPDYPQRRDSGPVHRALRYACLYWLHHLKLAPQNNEMQEYLLNFLQQRFFSAITAYATLGQLQHGIRLLKEASKLVTTRPNTHFTQNLESLAWLPQLLPRGLRSDTYIRPILLPFAGALQSVLGRTPTRYLWPGATVAGKLGWAECVLDEINTIVHKIFTENSKERFDMFLEMLNRYKLRQDQLQKKHFFVIWGWNADLNKHMAKCRDLWDEVLQQAGVDLKKCNSIAIKEFIETARQEAEVKLQLLSSPLTMSPASMSSQASPFRRYRTTTTSSHGPKGRYLTRVYQTSTDESAIGEMQEVFENLTASLSAERVANTKNGRRRSESFPVPVLSIPLPLNSSDSAASAPFPHWAESPGPY